MNFHKFGVTGACKTDGGKGSNLALLEILMNVNKTRKKLCLINVIKEE